MKSNLWKGILVVSSFFGFAITTEAAETTQTQLNTLQPTIQLTNRPSINLFPNFNFPTHSLNGQAATETTETTVSMEPLDNSSSQQETTSDSTTMSSSDDSFSQEQVTNETHARTGAEVQLNIIDVTQGNTILVSRSFYGDPYSELVIPVEANEGKIISIDNEQFVINENGGITGTYPGPDEVKSITVRMAPVGPTAVQANLSLLDEQYEPLPNVPKVTYYGKTGEQTNIELLAIEGYEFLYADSFNLIRNSTEDGFLYTFGETNETLNLIYEKTQELPDEESSEQASSDSSDPLPESDSTLVDTNDSKEITTVTDTSKVSTENNTDITKELANMTGSTSSTSTTHKKTANTTTSSAIPTKQQSSTSNKLPKTNALDSTTFSILGLMIVTFSGYYLKKRS